MHEAGHVVAAWGAGIPLMDVAIGQPLYDVDDTYFGKTSPDWENWEREGDDVDTASRIIQHVLGGPLAELVVVGRLQPAKANKDWHQILVSSEYLGLDSGQIVTKLRAATLSYLSAPRQRALIEEVADQLERDGCIRQPELDRLRDFL